MDRHDSVCGGTAPLPNWLGGGGGSRAPSVPPPTPMKFLQLLEPSDVLFGTSRAKARSIEPMSVNRWSKTSLLTLTNGMQEYIWAMCMTYDDRCISSSVQQTYVALSSTRVVIPTKTGESISKV